MPTLTEAASIPAQGPAAAAEPAAQATTAMPAAPSAKAAPKARKRAKGKEKAAEVQVATAAAVAVAAAAASPSAANDAWEIALTDRTLNAALARWAAAAGWQLLWELPVDYAVQARTTIPGKFEDAVTVVVASMEGAEIPMKAVFYQGNKVLRIMAKGAQ